MPEFPAELTYTIITGRFLKLIDDSADVDLLPDAVPASGAVTFSASVPYLLLPSTEPPVTIVVEPKTFNLDDEGYLVDENGSRGVSIISTDNPNVYPHGFTYEVQLKFDGVIPRRFIIEAPMNATVDLTTAAPIPAGSGTVEVISVETALRAEAAATRAETIATTLEATIVDEIKRVVAAGDYTGPQGPRGAPGKSAYTLAVENGFVGTEDEWLASLVGPAGPPGADSVVPGPIGKTGEDGRSAYEIAVANGYIGAETEWLASLKGERGERGPSGASAYEIAVAEGFVGTEAEWLESLKGSDGVDGIDGDQNVFGGRIFIQSSAPTNPQVGDIHLW